MARGKYDRFAVSFGFWRPAYSWYFCECALDTCF